MSLELKKGNTITIYIDPDSWDHCTMRRGVIVHISATTILLDLSSSTNVDRAGNMMHGLHNFRFNQIVRIDPY